VGGVGGIGGIGGVGGPTKPGGAVNLGGPGGNLPVDVPVRTAREPMPPAPPAPGGTRPVTPSDVQRPDKSGTTPRPIPKKYDTEPE
jgi:hypothetical protein